MPINEMKNYHSQFPVGQNVDFLLDDDSEIDFQIQTDSDSQKAYSWSDETDETWMDFGTFDWSDEIDETWMDFGTCDWNDETWMDFGTFGWSDETDETWMYFGTCDWNGDVQNVDLGFWTHSRNQCWDSYGWSDKTWKTYC